MRRRKRVLITNQRCPECGKYDYVGDQGHDRFFCRDCCLEFKVKGDTIITYIITEDGMSSVKDVIRFT